MTRFERKVIIIISLDQNVNTTTIEEIVNEEIVIEITITASKDDKTSIDKTGNLTTIEVNQTERIPNGNQRILIMK